MRTVLAVEDPADPRLADFRALTDVELRRRSEPEGGLFVAEGELVIRRVLRAGYALRSVLLSPKWLPALADVLDKVAAPVYVGEPALLEGVTGFHVHRGALASVERRPLPAPASLLPAARLVLVCEDVNSHTNLGAVFRCAAGLGMDAVLLSPRCADPLYRRSVRVSMGEVLALPYARLEPWPAGLGLLRGRGFRLLGLTPEPSATPLPALRPRPGERLALLLGAEGPGLSAAALAACDELVRIPMAHGVDSLNVAAAAAVACYALTADVQQSR